MHSVSPEELLEKYIVVPATATLPDFVIPLDFTKHLLTGLRL